MAFHLFLIHLFYFGGVVLVEHLAPDFQRIGKLAALHGEMVGQQGEAFYLLVACLLLLHCLYTLGHHLVNPGIGAQLLTAVKLYTVLNGVLLQQGIVGYD